MKLTAAQIEIENALHQINTGLARLVTLAGVKATVEELKSDKSDKSDRSDPSDRSDKSDKLAIKHLFKE